MKIKFKSIVSDLDIGLAWRYVKCVNSVLDDINLWNNLGFSLYTVLSIYYMVATLDK